MFEYHEPYLKIDADGVGVTVKLPEPLDIEKPLVELDLATSTITAVSQFVVSRSTNLPHYIDSRSEDESSQDTDEDYFVNGYTPADWDEGIDYKGEGNVDVFNRAIPFLELGVKGLIAFCQQESRGLLDWLKQAEVRSDEIEKSIEEQAEAAAAELERIMPKRDPAIAFEELKQFIEALGLEKEAHRSTLWKEIDGKQLHLHYTSFEMGSSWTRGNRHWEGMHEGIRLSQEELPEKKYNGRLGEVTVSERGYFAACKKESIFSGAEDFQDFPTAEEALDLLVPYILEGEEDQREGPTLPGLPLPPRR